MFPGCSTPERGGHADTRTHEHGCDFPAASPAAHSAQPHHRIRRNGPRRGPRARRRRRCRAHGGYLPYRAANRGGRPAGAASVQPGDGRVDSRPAGWHHRVAGPNPGVHQGGECSHTEGFRGRSGTYPVGIAGSALFRAKGRIAGCGGRIASTRPPETEEARGRLPAGS